MLPRRSEPCKPGCGGAVLACGCPGPGAQAAAGRHRLPCRAQARCEKKGPVWGPSVRPESSGLFGRILRVAPDRPRSGTSGGRVSASASDQIQRPDDSHGNLTRHWITSFSFPPNKAPEYGKATGEMKDDPGASGAGPVRASNCVPCGAAGHRRRASTAHEMSGRRRVRAVRGARCRPRAGARACAGSAAARCRRRRWRPRGRG